MSETSLAFAIIAITVLVASGIVYSVAWNSVESVTDARDERLAQDRALLRTEVNVTMAVWNEGDPLVDGDEFLHVHINNTGSTTLSVNASDLLIEGKYANYSADNVTVTVDGVDTDVWAPGETLHVEIEDQYVESVLGLSLTSAGPDRIKFVAGPGLAEWERVS